MKTILIIGATSAIAGAVARKFAKKGSRIFCLARTPEKMEVLMDDLKGAIEGSYCYDFNESAKADQAIKLAHQTLGRIDITLIAHGDLEDQQASEVDYQTARNTFETNLMSVISLLIPLSNLMIKQGNGKIGVLTSVAGERGRPRNYTYGAAKGALNLYLQGLRSRLWKSDIEIYNFKLGPVDTPMTVNHEKNFSFSTVDLVSTQIVKGFESQRYEQFIPSYWFWVMLFVRSIPETLFQKL
ncbi:MAG: SDR family NAD(P)-dependent oxidoreductase, partial [Proteobacteria bacterium]|nr:SDR family NAD(P)-dependent oxidoreductase [Pseudomonadota bacterium]